MTIETIIARSAQVLVALMGAYTVALWFVSIVWTYRDIETRSRNVVTQIFATALAVIFPFLGIPLYMVLRPKETLDGAFQRSLEEEYLLQDLEELPLCPGCHRFVNDDFVLCPHCHATLREPCTSCERLVDLRWSLCPFCAAPQDGRDTVERVEAPAARWTRPSRKIRRGAEERPTALPERTAASRVAASRSLTSGERAGGDRSGFTVIGGGAAARAELKAGGMNDGERREVGAPRRGRFQRPSLSANDGRESDRADNVTVIHADGD